MRHTEKAINKMENGVKLKSTKITEKQIKSKILAGDVFFARWIKKRANTPCRFFCITKIWTPYLRIFISIFLKLSFSPAVFILPGDSKRIFELKYFYLCEQPFSTLLCEIEEYKWNICRIGLQNKASQHFDKYVLVSRKQLHA